ncbi:MAG TPA: hypothetical protein VGI39_35215 [Polyangiaceae bacterium]|jgi:hypothetical protein
MPSRRTPLAHREALVSAHDVLVSAAVLAAHGASPARGGFRMSDVRFFFFLFSNWLEHDLLRRTQSLELTQVRRLLGRLVERRWARSPAARTFALTPAGLLGLVDEMTGHLDARSFEETLFVVCFARCYAPAILQRVPAARRARARTLLDPERLLQEAERRVERVTADLEERVRSSEAMQREALAMRRGGLPEGAIASALDRRGAYQLQHVRAYAEVMRSLPEDVLRFEVGEGLGVRSEVLFEPMVELAGAQRAIVQRLRGRLTEKRSR